MTTNAEGVLCVAATGSEKICHGLRPTLCFENAGAASVLNRGAPRAVVRRNSAAGAGGAGFRWR
jgi:hypothetical protein